MSEGAKSSRISRKLFFVYFLNVIDWLCTIALLSTGMFYEANPIARTFIDSVTLGFLIKCLLPFVAIIFCARCMHILQSSQLRFADMLISFALTVYIAIALDHIINFLLLVFL